MSRRRPRPKIGEYSPVVGPHVTDEDLTPERLESLALMASPHGFREFLNHWHFLDQDSGEDRVLGEVLWEAQEEFVATATLHWWIYYLKARQLGETTIECAFDAWVMRFRDSNARVHVFSKRDEEAVELLDRIKYGFDMMEDWLKLPVRKSTTHELIFDASHIGDDGEIVKDRRMAKAYPADKNPSRSATCTHAHLDEWTFMGDPKRVWQAVQPSAAGTVHFVTTSEGPTNYTSDFWVKCIQGDVKDRRGNVVHACFIGALKRPDRDARWLEDMRASMDEASFNWEYPTTWEQAISAGGDLFFKTEDVKLAGIEFNPLGPPVPGRKYAKGADIGRHADAAVIIVLDVTEDVHDVVYYKRLRRTPYPIIQAELEEVHKLYKGPLGIEKNHAGEAVIENLNIPEQEAEDAKFITSHSSKARIISQVNLGLQNGTLKWDPEACHQLTAEVKGYRIPDDKVVQDSVIALAIAEEYAAKAHTTGRVGRIRQW